MFSYLINRAKEKATWAGIAALAVVFGVPAEFAHLAAEAIVAVASAAAVLMPTEKPE